MNNFIDVIEVIFCISLLLHHKTFKVKCKVVDCSLFYPLAVYCEKQPKITMFMGVEKY